MPERPDPSRELPPFVYLACHEPIDDIDDIAALRPMSRGLTNGGLGLQLYTALDRLRRAQGDDVPWVVLALPALHELQEHRRYDAFLVDDGLPEEQRAHG